ncbi:unnamed protein product, partial [Ceratitis capitata]
MFAEVISLAASAEMLGVGDIGECASEVEEIERWLQKADVTATITWANQTAIELLPKALISDIDAHLLQPLQRRI